MTKLFVGGISQSISNDQLKDLFAKFGDVASATIVMDKFSGQGKGFGFVEMTNDAEAQQAIKELDGYGLDGRKIGVSVARPKEDSQNRNGGGNNNNFQRRDNFKKDNYRR